MRTTLRLACEGFVKATSGTRKDHERGVRLLFSAAQGRGEAAERAKKLIDDLEKIAKGVDPGWKAADKRL